MGISIDEEFKARLRPLSESERNGLQESLLADGKCIAPIVLWAGTNIIIDGHNRFEICSEHGIPFETTELEFDDREDVLIWIDKHQLHSRNLNKTEYKEILGRYYSTKRKKAGAPKGNKNAEAKPKDKEEQCGQLDHIESEAERTEAKIAEEVGVSPRTVRRAGKAWDLREELEKAGHTKKSQIIKKGSDQLVNEATVIAKESGIEVAARYIDNATFGGAMSVNQAQAVRKLNDESQKSILQAISEGASPKDAIKAESEKSITPDKQIQLMIDDLLINKVSAGEHLVGKIRLACTVAAPTEARDINKMFAEIRRIAERWKGTVRANVGQAC